MRVVPPLVMTDAILTSSSATEPWAPAAYAGGTTYAAGAIIQVAADFTIYESIADGNLGNTPSTSPTKWRILGPTELAYSAATTYAVGDTVSSAATHRVYESLAASNLGNPLPVPPALTTTKWLDIGPTNKWAMFDYLRNTKTVFASPLAVTLTPSVPNNALVGFDVDATSYAVSMVVGADTVYTASGSLVTRQVNDWYDYFFELFTTKRNFALLDLPSYYNGVTTLTLTNTGGNVKVGALVMGSAENIGKAMYKAQSDVLNFSTIARELDGSAVITQRRNVPALNVTTYMPKARAGRMMLLRDDLNAVPAAWLGLEDDGDDWFTVMQILGIAKKWVINVDSEETVVQTFELEGM